ncbi:MAG: hypothetical protein EOO77_29395 [Oxalobacteraceae bacterium]|nr:MAG: hypothetical protein EOO77_29395 [Oxalobacteraceae bacterium]
MTKRSVEDLLSATRKELLGSDPAAALEEWKVKIPLIRRIMPQIIANEIVSAQPMTAANAFMHTLRARFDPWGCQGNCVEDSWGYFFETVVDFPQGHPVYKDGEEARLWAIQNVRKPFTYAVVEIASTIQGKWSERVWRWSFADQDEAFQFKVRWM